MKKRNNLISLLIVLAIVFTSISPIFARSTIKDMSEGWSKRYMEAALENKILIGDNGKVRPKDNMTRAEFVTVISRILGLSEKADVSQYTDVEPGAWYYEDIARAVKVGLVDGRASTKMEPNGSIKREEAFTIIARMLLLSENENHSNVFVDNNKISDWARPSINALTKGSYIEGNDYRQIKPRHNITREEMAALLYRLINLYVGEDLVGKEIVGNVVANDNLENIKDTTIHGDLILGEGVDVEEVKLNNVKVHGRLVVRSGADLRIINGSEINHAKAIDKTITTLDKASELNKRNINIIIKEIEGERPGEGEEKPKPEKPEKTPDRPSLIPGGEEKPGGETSTKQEKPEDKLEVTEVTAIIEPKEIKVKETAQITVTAKDEEGKDVKDVKYKYETNKEAIATVDKDGKVIGVAEGTATITVTTTNTKEVKIAEVKVEVTKAAEGGESQGNEPASTPEKRAIEEAKKLLENKSVEVENGKGTDKEAVLKAIKALATENRLIQDLDENAIIIEDKKVIVTLGENIKVQVKVTEDNK